MPTCHGDSCSQEAFPLTPLAQASRGKLSCFLLLHLKSTGDPALLQEVQGALRENQLLLGDASQVKFQNTVSTHLPARALPFGEKA